MRIPWSLPDIGDEEKKLLNLAFDSSWISGGEFVSKFEQSLETQLKANHIVSVTSGTSALELAFRTLGIGPGDEVIIPAFTFAAPVNMCLAVGATPILADVNADTWLLDLENIEAVMSDRTRAIVVVHLYGQVCDMDPIMKLARDKGIFVIEDTAEAMFSRYQGKFAGTMGDAGCFSFQATKTITMGEGGATAFATTANEERARLFRNHGMSPDVKYYHHVPGHNFRLTNLQAAIGVGQLNRCQSFIKTRKLIGDQYHTHLKDHKDCFQKQTDGSDVVPWIFPLLLKGASSEEREKVRKTMADQGIETRPGFVSLTKLPYIKSPSLPNSEKLSEEILTLPLHTSLTEKDVKFISESVKELI